MQVRKHPILPLESIVRGYITGSAWAEYQRSGTVHGIPMPQGLKESQKLDKPIWTPSTKAEQGAHDENISPAKAREMVGAEVAGKVEEVSLRVYGMVSFFLFFFFSSFCPLFYFIFSLPPLALRPPWLFLLLSSLFPLACPTPPPNTLSN